VSTARWKLVLSGLVGVVVVAGIAVGLVRGGGDGDASPALVRGGPSLAGTTPAPAVSGPGLSDGARIDLASFRGTPVIVNAWASWCGPCREEAPDIKRFTRERTDVAFLGVNLNDDRSNARKFNAEAGWIHPSIYDPDGKVGFDTLKVTQLPATIYIDANGVIRGRTQGPVTYQDLVSVADRIR
jgi:thiol-disulfide isomerase/thioredoxin